MFLLSASKAGGDLCVSTHSGDWKIVPSDFNIRPPQRCERSGLPRAMKCSKRFEGMPAFGVPVLCLIFVIEPFLCQTYGIKPCIFFREVRMKSLRRFCFRICGAHESKKLTRFAAIVLVFSQNCHIVKRY